MIILAISACLLIVVDAKPPQRIIGGINAPDHKYPYLVSLRMRRPGLPDWLFCGGSIVDDRFILTAAHCTDVILAGNDCWATAGSNYLDTSGDHYKIERAFIPHNYTDFSQNDIALLRIVGQFQFHQYVSKVNLPMGRFEDYNAHIDFAGWGYIVREPFGRQEVPTQLQEVNLHVIDENRCRQTYWYLSDRHLCTFNEGKREGACLGDSGSPLVVDNVQIGVFSFLLDCETTGPDVFTRVFSYILWIQSTIAANP